MIAGGIMLTGVTVFGLRVLGAKIIVRKIENWRKDNRKFRWNLLSNSNISTHWLIDLINKLINWLIVYKKMYLFNL